MVRNGTSHRSLSKAKVANREGREMSSGAKNARTQSEHARVLV